MYETFEKTPEWYFDKFLWDHSIHVKNKTIINGGLLIMLGGDPTCNVIDANNFNDFCQQVDQLPLLNFCTKHYYKLITQA